MAYFTWLQHDDDDDDEVLIPAVNIRWSGPVVVW